MAFFKRTLPPAAAPIPLQDILKAIPSCFHDQSDFRFENEIKKEFKQDYCFLVSSGKAALTLILKALHQLHPDRDEVIIPAFTCYSVPAAIKKAGLRIKLCDTEKNSLDLSKERLKELVSPDKKNNKILCVLITHLFGCPADFDNIKKILGNNIPIVEDAAQAMGEEVDGKRIGTQGDVGFFSLGRGKALSTMEGGVIISNRLDLSKKLTGMTKDLEQYPLPDKIKLVVMALLTSLLQHPLFFGIPKSLPFLKLGETFYENDFTIREISSVQKRLGHNWIKRLKEHQKDRISNITFWKKHLPQNFSILCTNKKPPSLIRLPLLTKSKKDRDDLFFRSEQQGLGLMTTYPTPINKIPEISCDFSGLKFPNAQNLVDCLITLPVHKYVSTNDRSAILQLFSGVR